jgi:hypothetical protein
MLNGPLERAFLISSVMSPSFLLSPMERHASRVSFPRPESLRPSTEERQRLKRLSEVFIN